MVSRFRVIVVSEAKATHSPKSSGYRPRPARATHAATTSKTWARPASSASTITVARNASRGPMRRIWSAAGPAGRSPVAAASSPARSSPAASQSSGCSRRSKETAPERTAPGAE